MTKRHFVWAVVGAACMSWGGASIAAALSFTGWRQIDVRLFAIGIILLAQAPIATLSRKVWDLESRLAATSPSSTAQAG